MIRLNWLSIVPTVDKGLQSWPIKLLSIQSKRVADQFGGLIEVSGTDIGAFGSHKTPQREAIWR